jgi:hypothetical protein
MGKLSTEVTSSVVVTDIEKGNAYLDASWLLKHLWYNLIMKDIVVSTLIPATFSRFGPDSAAGAPLSNTSCLYSSSGSLNTNVWTSIANHLMNATNKLQPALGPTARIMWVDSNCAVGFDSSRCTLTNGVNTGLGANVTATTGGPIVPFAKTWVSNNINENHFNRIEFPLALCQSHSQKFSFTAMSRLSTTLRKAESRAIICVHDIRGLPLCMYGISRLMGHGDYNRLEYSITSNTRAASDSALAAAASAEAAAASALAAAASAEAAEEAADAIQEALDDLATTSA